MEKLRTNYVLKSRIVALALISIMLSSSSFSVADGYTIWFEVKEINAETTPNSNEQFYKINLLDGVSSRITSDVYDNGKPYQINLIDGILAIISNDKNYQKHQLTTENNQKPISVN